MAIARPIRIAAAVSLALAGCKSSPPPPQPPPPMAAAIDPSRAVPFVGVNNVFAPLRPGDAIVITAVRGPADRIAVGNTYVIDGAYTLGSRDAATLSAYETAAGPGGPHTAEVAGQSVAITRGSGTFSLHLRIDGPGYPHVSFYPTAGGGSFGGEYFGTGDFAPPAAWRVDQRPPAAR